MLSGNDLAIAPPELLDYLICKEFGWTIDELNEQPVNEVLKFVQIMAIQRQQEKIREQSIQNG